MLNFPFSAAKIISPFGIRIHPIKKEKKFHFGIDLVPVQSRIVNSCVDGEIIEIKDDGEKDFGKWVIQKTLINNITYWLFYAHLFRIYDFTPNQKVKAGDPLGVCGSTCSSAGIHLHLQFMKNEPKNEYALNPLKYFKETSYNKIS